MLRFEVLGMTCGHCVQTITKSVQGLDPSAQVNADISAKTVTVQSQARKSAVADAIRGAGYEVAAD